jgi:hypothetical protein
MAKPEEIIAKLRRVDILTSRGQTLAARSARLARARCLRVHASEHTIHHSLRKAEIIRGVRQPADL